MENSTLSPLEIISEAAQQPTESQRQRDFAIEQSRTFLVPIDEVLPPKEAFIEVNGIPLIAPHDILVVKGAPKSGKSTLDSILMGIAIGGCSFGPISCLRTGLKVTYVDTEMDRHDTQRIARQAAAIAGDGFCSDRLCSYNLRKCSPEEILAHIPSIFEDSQPDMMVIDGALDLVHDFNSVEESQNLVKEHMLKWADRYNCAIVIVIHTNKTNNLATSQGHLGGALDKKAENVLLCDKDADHGIINVSAPTCRHKDIPRFAFMYGANGFPIPADDMAREISLQQHAERDIANEQRTQERLLNDYTRILSHLQPDTTSIAEKELRNIILTDRIRTKNHVTGLIKNLTNAGLLAYDTATSQYLLTRPD